MNNDDQDPNLQRALLSDAEEHGDRKPPARPQRHVESEHQVEEVQDHDQVESEVNLGPFEIDNLGDFSSLQYSALLEEGFALLDVPDEGSNASNFQNEASQFDEWSSSATEPSPSSPGATSRKKRKTRREITEEHSYEMLEQLRAFKAVHGHCNVPQIDGPLGNWVARVRKLKKQNKHHASLTLNSYIMAKLDELNFRWEFFRTGDGNFEQRLEELREFKKDHGHCIVLTNTSLGRWVTTMRHEYKKFMCEETRSLATKIDQKKIDSLNEMGFKWSMS